MGLGGNHVSEPRGVVARRAMMAEKRADVPVIAAHDDDPSRYPYRHRY